MGYLPINLSLEGRPCVVIGGGAVAGQRVESLLAAGARVTLIAPEIGAGLAALADTHELVHLDRTWRPGDLAGVFLAVAATGDSLAQRAIADEAERFGVLLNVADVPALCSVTFPAVLRHGDFTVAIATGGASPGLARVVRDELGGWIGPEYGSLTAILAEVRRRLDPGAARRRVFVRLLQSPLLEWLRQGQPDRINELLTEVTGEALTLKVLGLEHIERAGGGVGEPHGS